MFCFSYNWRLSTLQTGGKLKTYCLLWSNGKCQIVSVPQTFQFIKNMANRHLQGCITITKFRTNSPLDWMPKKTCLRGNFIHNKGPLIGIVKYDCRSELSSFNIGALRLPLYHVSFSHSRKTWTQAIFSCEFVTTFWSFVVSFCSSFLYLSFWQPLTISSDAILTLGATKTFFMGRNEICVLRFVPGFTRMLLPLLTWACIFAKYSRRIPDFHEIFRHVGRTNILVLSRKKRNMKILVGRPRENQYSRVSYL